MRALLLSTPDQSSGWMRAFFRFCLEFHTGLVSPAWDFNTPWQTGKGEGDATAHLLSKIDVNMEIYKKM